MPENPGLKFGKSRGKILPQLIKNTINNDRRVAPARAAPARAAAPALAAAPARAAPARAGGPGTISRWTRRTPGPGLCRTGWPPCGIYWRGTTKLRIPNFSHFYKVVFFTLFPNQFGRYQDRKKVRNIPFSCLDVVQIGWEIR